MARSILIVEDSNTVRRRVRETLERAGYVVLEAADGKAALRSIASRVPDLVITDVNMAQMNGIELTSEIRRHHSKQALPIIVLSTESSESMRDQGRAVGASGWIVKPIDDKKLCAVVEHVLAGRGA